MRIWILIALNILAGCASVRFSPPEGGASTDTSPYGNRIIYSVSCDAENKEQQKIIELPHDASRYVYHFSPSCVRDLVDKEFRITMKPVNIVIALDRSASMSPGLTAVKAGIADLAKLMENNGWDVQFAALGFRDDASDFLITPFTSAKTLSKNLASWRAEGGSDPQEAGLKAIETSADILEAYAHSRPGRKNAINIILYSSDSVAYSGPDHMDFSVDKLSNIAAGWKKIFGDFRIYYSVPQKIDPSKKWGLDSDPPDIQLDNFMKKSSVKGKRLSFPLSPNAFQELFKEAKKITKIEQLACAANTATLETTPLARTSKWDSKDKILNRLTNGTPLDFKTSPDPEVVEYYLKISRCCHAQNRVNSEADCSKIVERQFHLRFRSTKKT